MTSGEIGHTHDVVFDGDIVRKRFVTWADGEADREWAGLVTLDRAAPGLAPRPIAYRRAGDGPVVTMSRVPGRALGGEPVSAKQRSAMVDALRILFAVPVPAGLDERPFGPSMMRARVCEWAADDYDLRACLAPRLVETALAAVRESVAVPDPWCDRIVEPVTARGDGNLANLLWDGATCRLVDFEEFGVSDPTFEIADIVEHAAARFPPVLDVTALIEQFELEGRQRARLLVHRRLLAAFWLVMLLPGNRGFVRNPAGTTESQAEHLIGLFAAG